jgi:hypothetical protein
VRFFDVAASTDADISRGAAWINVEGNLTMAIPWNDRVNFNWENSRLAVGRAMSLGAAVDYFDSLSATQKEVARISLSSPVQLITDLPPAYELNGDKIAALVALRHAG